MKIGILAPYTRPWDDNDVEGSGMNVFIRESAEALAQNGHDITVFVRASRAGDDEYVDIATNIRVRYLVAGSQERMGREEVYTACQVAAVPIDEICDHDILIAHYWIAQAWVKKVRDIYKKKILYFSHSFFMNPQRDQCNHMQTLAETWMAIHTIWCAYSSREYNVVKHAVGPERCRLVHVGTKVSTTTKGYDNNKNGNILFVGRKCSANGYDLFLEIARKCTAEKFLAIGRSYGKSVTHSHHNVQEIGFMPFPSLIKYMREAKLIICPSRYEHFGLVPLLATALGITVIASDQGGHNDVIIDGKTGFCVDTNDPDVYCAYIHKALSNEFSYSESSRLEVLQMFSWEKHVADIEEIVMESEVLYKGVVMTVERTPQIVHDRLVYFERVIFPGSVHVVPMIDDDIIFIKEKRIGNSRKGYQMRVLSGVIDKGESPIDAARRELEEELGLKAKTMELFMHFRKDDAIRDERYYFIARELVDGTMKHDRTEDIEGSVRLSKKRVRALTSDGFFGKGETAIALLKICGKINMDE